MTASKGQDAFIVEEIRRELGLQQDHLVSLLSYLTRRQDEIYSAVVGSDAFTFVVPDTPSKAKTKLPLAPSLTWKCPDTNAESADDADPISPKLRKGGSGTKGSDGSSMTQRLSKTSRKSEAVPHHSQSYYSRLSYHAHSPNSKKWLSTAQKLGVYTDQERMEAARKKHQDNRDVSSREGKISGITVAQKSFLKRMVQSHHFELFFALVIVTNSFFVGVQVQYSASNQTDETPGAFYVIQYCYAFIFTSEIILRIWTSGGNFFRCGQENVGWNYLDAFVVSTTLFETVMDTIYLASSTGDSGSGITSSASNARIVRILRIARLMRIIRVARILRFIHALRTFIYSIIATLKSLVWALVLLFMIVYLFGILFTQAAGDWLIDEGDDYKVPVDDPAANYKKLIEKYWGNLPRSMFTLFKSISGGVSWDDVVHPAAQFGWVWVGVFTLYISFTYFAVLNVVTGIFCQSAIESAQQNEDLMVQAQIASKELYVSRIKNLFANLDEDGSGSLTIAELEDNLMNENVQAVFASMDIDSKDAWTLFKMLSPDEGCEVTSEDFVEGLMRLKGNAKRADFVELHVLIKRLDSTSHAMVNMVDKLSQRVSQVSHFCHNHIVSSRKDLQSTNHVLANGFLSGSKHSPASDDDKMKDVGIRGSLSKETTAADDDQSRRLIEVFQQDQWYQAFESSFFEDAVNNKKAVALRLSPCTGDKSSVNVTSLDEDADPQSARSYRKDETETSR